jgi:hypothetical protein
MTTHDGSAGERTTAGVTSWPGVEDARRIETDEDVRDVVALLRLNYNRLVSRFGVPVGGPEGGPR